jgi:hypothetical protein
MANSKNIEVIHCNDLGPGPVDNQKGAIAAEGSSSPSDIGPRGEDSDNFEDPSNITLSRQGTMDFDDEMKTETVAESWAESMDGIDLDHSNLQSNTYAMDDVRTEQRNNIHEGHSPARYIQGPRSSCRPTGGRVYRDQRSQSRGRGFRDRGFIDRALRGRQPRGRDSRSQGGGYHSPQHFLPRGLLSSQTTEDSRTKSQRGRWRTNLEQDSNNQYWWADRG